MVTLKYHNLHSIPLTLLYPRYITGALMMMPARDNYSIHVADDDVCYKSNPTTADAVTYSIPSSMKVMLLTLSHIL